MLYGILGAVLFATIGGLLFYLRHDNRKIGKAEEKEKVAEELLYDSYLVKKARDALAASHDSAASKLLRDKYTRRP